MSDQTIIAVMETGSMTAYYVTAIIHDVEEKTLLWNLTTDRWGCGTFALNRGLTAGQGFNRAGFQSMNLVREQCSHLSRAMR